MAISSDNRHGKNIGAWQEVFNAVRSERIEKARERVRKEAELSYNFV